jgi:hypothetical protein
MLSCGYLQNRLDPPSLPLLLDRQPRQPSTLLFLVLLLSRDPSELDQTLLFRHNRSVLRRRRETLLSVTCTRSGSLRPVVLWLGLVQLGISTLLLRLCWLGLRLLVVGLRGLALQRWLLLLGSFLRRVGRRLLVGLLLLRRLLRVKFWARCLWD